MILPCIDLMDGKVVQLVQGRDKALEGGSPAEMLDRFAAFPEIQVIDLDAAIGKGANDDLVEFLAARARCRIGGGVRTVERARKLVEQGAHRVIIGTSAFSYNGINALFLQSVVDAIGREKILIAVDSKDGKVVVKGWRESTRFTAEEMVPQLEQYCGGFLCTYVDKEGMMQGTDLNWFARLRAATANEITAAGGITTLDDVRALQAMGVHAALGMAIYTGRLDLAELARINNQGDRNDMTRFASQLLTVVAEMQARPGKEDELRRQVRALVDPTRQEEGCVQYDLHESVDTPGRFVFYENWTSPAALEKHGVSPHIQAFRAVRDQLLAEPARILKYTRIA